jgi:hypothetical protein
MKLKHFVTTKYTDKNNIQKAELRLLKFFKLSSKMDSNFGNHLWFNFRVGPFEMSTGFRSWDESPEAVEKYKEDFNIIEMNTNLAASDA